MKEFKIFIDENLPPQLARGLHILQEPQNEKDAIKIEVISIKDFFGQGAKDVDWIPQIGKMRGVVITQDYRIQSTRHERELYKDNHVGVLFFTPPSKTGFGYWEMVRQIVKRWDEIKRIVRKNKPPFAFRCSARTDFENIDN